MLDIVHDALAALLLGGAAALFAGLAWAGRAR
jgi:hypothetical protein